MRKEILICDHCKKETDWLYSFYHIHIDGKLVTVDKEGYAEYCKDCMLCNGYFFFPFIDFDILICYSIFGVFCKHLFVVQKHLIH